MLNHKMVLAQDQADGGFQASKPTSTYMGVRYPEAESVFRKGEEPDRHWHVLLVEATELTQAW